MRGISLILCILLPLSLYSLDNKYKKEQSLSLSSAYYFPTHEGYKLSGNFAPIKYSVINADSETQRNLGSTWGSAELKATYKLSLTRSFLEGSSHLTKNNNIKYTFISEVSPVSSEIGGEIKLAPIAFLDFSLGSTIATGWKAIGVYGLALNNKNNEYPNNNPFQGVLSQTWISGTFKSDIAALLSGDTTWKHIILLSNHRLTFKNFSGASNDEPWVYQGSEGNKYNGFVYKHITFFGYQMPIMLEKAGFILETETSTLNYNKSSIDDGGWGSDYLKIRIGCLFNLKFSDKHSVAVTPQFSNSLKYTDSTNRELYFKNREVNTNSPYYWKFERIALIYSYKF